MGEVQNLEDLIANAPSDMFINKCMQTINILEGQRAEFNFKYVDYTGVNDAYNFAIKLIEEKINNVKGESNNG